MAEQFAALMEPVARFLLGEPNARMSSPRELRYGSRGSLSVDLQKGTWFDNELGQGGGLLDLVTRETKLEGKQRFDWLHENGFDVDDERHTNGHADAKLGQIVATYPYEDESGKLLFQVVRFEPKNFRQRRPDREQPDGWAWGVRGVQQVPYRLPELSEPLAQGHVVFIVEGEKDADNLLRHRLPATTNAGGAGKWKPELSEFFRGADVVIIPDRDPQKRHPKTKELMFHPDGRAVLPGQDHAQAVAAALDGTAARVRVLELWQSWPDMPFKGDVSDWIKAGGTPDVLYALVDQLPDWTPRPGVAPELPKLPAVLFPFPIDERGIPPRDWIVPGLLMRRQVTVVVAPSGSGKSLLTLQVGMTCAQGKNWSGWITRGAFNVMVINSEDDIDEMRRRLAAATHRMEIDQEAIRNRLMLVDNSDAGAVVAKFDGKSKTLVRTPLLEQIVTMILDHHIDIVFVDPFAETFEGDENSNSELKWAGMLWREVARRTKAAVCLVHHTKKYATGMAGDVDAARGAGALIGIARIVSTLFPMTTKEAEAMGIAPQRRGHFLRYDDAKANLNVVSPFARWFEKVTITLDNATTELPGDEVGVLVPWKPVGPSVLEDQIIAFFNRVDTGLLDEHGNPTGEFYTLEAKGHTGRTSERYLAGFAQEFFHFDAMSQAESLIEGWRKSKRLLNGPRYKSPQTRKMRTRVISQLSPLARKPDEPPPDPQERFQYDDR